MKNQIVYFLSLLFLSTGLLHAQSHNLFVGIVLDNESGIPVSGAHVFAADFSSGSITDEQGKFYLKIKPSVDRIVISHISYKTKRIETGAPYGSGFIEISIEPVSQSIEGELVITSGRIHPMSSGLYNDVKTKSVEDHLGRIPGLDLVSRANFAKDPVIRGLRNGRVDVLIDGMRMTPACVDGMDPLTAYVETDNLQAIEIDRGHTNSNAPLNTSGGSVNFQMVRPSLDTGLQAGVETGYQSVSSQQAYQAMIAFGEKEFGIRISGTYRNAGDLKDGQNRKISGSSFEKGNVHASIIYDPAGSHRFGLQYIGDFAGNIGYPALIMDTRSADANLLGIEHNWNRPVNGVPNIKTGLYVNTVKHRMDDYNRDVTQRDVMQDMHMPMYGNSVTYGFHTTGKYLYGRHMIDIRIESYLLEAFADMWMHHLNPDISDMYLVNLGDVSNWNSSISAGYTMFLGNGWRLGTDLRLGTGLNRIEGQSAVSTYRAEYPGLTDLEPVGYTYLAGINAEKDFSEYLTAGIRISDGYRLPDHMEKYGYYIYQPLDGFFYIGNPGIKPERSSQGEVFLTYGSGASLINGSTAFWVNRMDDYIAGIRYDSIFKRYQNMGVAYLYGTETELNLNPHENWDIRAGLSYVFGYHRLLNEPLPMIPPLSGSISIQKNGIFIDLETRLRWAASQNRIASDNSLETNTPGHVVSDIYGRIKVSENVRLQIGLENIFNSYYVNHLSVNSMPSPGRNLQFSIRFDI
jgi:iron complex outermembrane recepter protein